MARKTTSPIPDPLWAVAAECSREHGVFRTVKVLRFEYSKFKRLARCIAADGRRTIRLAASPARRMVDDKLWKWRRTS
jgi:hypothetical protein